MSAQIERIVTAAPVAQQRDPLAGVRQLAYAWIGMWGAAAEDLGSFYRRCVTRGEQIMNAKPPAAPLSVEHQVNDTTGSWPRTAAPRAIRPTSIFNAFGAVESYHIDLNAEGILPTKQELDALAERVET